jgi:hypothetical protein
MFLLRNKAISLLVLCPLVVMGTASEKWSCTSSWGLSEGQLRQSKELPSELFWLWMASTDGGETSY